MRKKTTIISIAIIALIAFGTVSSAHAIVEPVSLAVVLGAGFITLVTASEGIKHTQAEIVQKQETPSEAKQKKVDAYPKSGLITQTTVNLSE